MEFSIKRLFPKEVKQELAVFIVAKGLAPHWVDLPDLKEFEGKEGQVWSAPTHNKSYRRVLYYGLGEPKDVIIDSFRRAAGTAVRNARANKCTSVCVFLPHRYETAEYVQALTEGALLAEHVFDRFKTKKDDHPPELKSFVIVGNADLKKAMEKGEILARAQNFVRQINEHPANMMTPEKLAELAKQLAKEKKLHVTVFDKNAIKKMGMEGILAVNRGSALPPVMVVLEYNKDKKNLPLYCVVGKGITFDSGGISIKPSKGMHEMKYDKTGAVNVFGIMKAAAELHLPIRLLGIFPATENMPGGNAQKPGDIIRAYNGKTIEVLNTDAEGRLILADALSYAAERKPEYIIDMATLTGAISVALGPHAMGLFSNNDKLANAIMESGIHTHERAWLMPTWKEYADFIKADFADIKNTGSEMGEASSITASKFLEEFVNGVPWAHLDIAAVDMVKYPHPYMEKGASGIGVRLVIETLERLAKK
jgi:leucyl aminopeptidase